VRHFTIELEELNQHLMQMGGLVASAIHLAVGSLIEQNRELAEEVIRQEPTINRMEKEIDGIATRLLALRQPVACDLRRLTVALKITTDLERIGDFAFDVAQRSLNLMKQPAVKPMTDIPKIAALVQSMLLKCLNAFVNSDADVAHSVLLADDEVHQFRDGIQAELKDAMQRDPAVASAAIDLLFIARDLERTGDHATNIAEDVIFLAKGIDVRHGAQQPEEA
jgi:phosphate transport system protein